MATTRSKSIAQFLKTHKIKNIAEMSDTEFAQFLDDCAAAGMTEEEISGVIETDGEVIWRLWQILCADATEEMAEQGRPEMRDLGSWGDSDSDSDSDSDNKNKKGDK